jgi:hypothetical protein
MIPDPPVRTFLVNAGRALDAAEVIANEVLPASTVFGRRGPEVQILSLRPACLNIFSSLRRHRRKV